MVLSFETIIFISISITLTLLNHFVYIYICGRLCDCHNIHRFVVVLYEKSTRCGKNQWYNVGDVKVIDMVIRSFFQDEKKLLVTKATILGFDQMWVTTYEDLKTSGGEPTNKTNVWNVTQLWFWCQGPRELQQKNLGEYISFSFFM